MWRACDPGRIASTSSSPRAWMRHAKARTSNCCGRKRLKYCSWAIASMSGSWVASVSSKASAPRTFRAGIWSLADWPRPTSGLASMRSGASTRDYSSASRMRSATRCSKCVSASACATRRPAWGAPMRGVLAANGQAIPASAPGFELNVAHPLVRYRDGLTEAEPFSELALLLYDQASLADEGQVANGAEFARRLNKLLVRLVEPRQ